jgi:hypothetical protein
MRPVRSTVRSLTTILVAVGAMMLCGCSSSVEQATAADVNNRAFAFPTGAVFHAAPANMPATLTFTDNATTFALSSAWGSATGTNGFGSCILTVTASTYAAGIGPQVHDVIALSPCEFDSTDNTLSVTNGTITATSAPAVTTGTSSS